jgi:hypothetical protein
MTLAISTGLANALLDGQFNAGAGAGAFDSGVLEIRTGAAPGPDAAPTGTLLVSITLPADAFAAATGKHVAKAGTWSNTAAAAGTAAHFRMKTSGDGGGSSTTDKRIEGTVTATGGGGDATVDNTNIASGQTVTVNSFQLNFP